MSDDQSNPKETKSSQPPQLSRDHKRTTVRFTDEEFERIEEESRVSGISIPILLRMSHFKRRKLKLLFDEDGRKFICSELRRIGNNVNQIAYRVNAGVLEGWYDDFFKVAQMLAELQQVVVEAYGSR